MNFALWTQIELDNIDCVGLSDPVVKSLNQENNTPPLTHSQHHH